MPLPQPMRTPRLLLSPLTAGEIAAFHGLITDAHVRRFVVDGAVMPLEWAAEQVERSLGLFERIGSGLWLARPPGGAGEPIGFCGFVDLSHSGLGPELIYALREAGTGAGLATEMARSMIDHARLHVGVGRILASVDAVNERSVRVLEKLGFRVIETRQGAFGKLLVFGLGEG
ncbi:MAG TPA: GNAT family N-acetyltransferase [Thermoanaerobaculia bacterium]|nr:GNAT family N-acetyltransferase [Thermoanaerobaculia bacterium]